MGGYLFYLFKQPPTQLLFCMGRVSGVTLRLDLIGSWIDHIEILIELAWGGIELALVLLSGCISTPMAYV